MPTCEDLVTNEDLANAKLDTTTLAEVATSRAGGVSTGARIDSTTNRFGDTVSTVNGQLLKMGYEPPIAYAGSIAFGTDDGVKTIERANVIYAPLLSSLPFTTTGTWAGSDESNFYLVQRSRFPVFSDYAALRGIDLTLYSDRDVVFVTDSGIAGDFTLRNVPAHGLTDNGGTIIVIDSDWYAERVYSDRLVANWFDNGFDDSLWIQEALDFARERAEDNGAEIDHYSVYLSPTKKYSCLNNIEIPKRITLDATACNLSFSSGAGFVFGQAATLIGTGAQFTFASGRTTAAVKKDSGTGAANILGYPKFSGTDSPIQDSVINTSDVGLDARRMRYSTIQAEFENFNLGLYANVQTDTAYYNDFDLTIENTNYGIYTIGQGFNSNRLRVKRNSRNYDCLYMISGSSATAGSGNIFIGGYWENTEHIGVRLVDAGRNTFIQLIIEGLPACLYGYDLSGSCFGNQFVNCDVGGSLDRSKFFTQGAGCTRTNLTSRFGNLVNASGAITGLFSDEGVTLNGGSNKKSIVTVSDGSSAVNMSGSDILWLSNTSASDLITINSESTSEYAHEITVKFDGNTTIRETGNIRLLTGSTKTPVSGSILKFINAGSSISANYFEMGEV